jgi:hypothetical protein
MGGNRNNRGGNPWLYGAGGFLAGSWLSGGSGGGVLQMLPLLLLGGAALGVVAMLKK